MYTIYQKNPNNIKDIGVCSYIYWNKYKKYSKVINGVEYILIGLDSYEDRDHWSKELPLRINYKLVVECIHQGKTDDKPVKRYAILADLNPTEIYKNGLEIPLDISHKFRGTLLGKSMIISLLRFYNKEITNLKEVQCYLEEQEKILEC